MLHEPPSRRAAHAVSSRVATACTVRETPGIAVTYGRQRCGIVHPDSALGLYRITQEALHNVAKHAAAQRVDVTLQKTANALQLSIADDGKGFDPAHRRGLGLVSIDERARLLGGDLEIATRPGRGTLVRVEIPLPSVTLSGSSSGGRRTLMIHEPTPALAGRHCVRRRRGAITSARRSACR